MLQSTLEKYLTSVIYVTKLLSLTGFEKSIKEPTLEKIHTCASYAIKRFHAFVVCICIQQPILEKTRVTKHLGTLAISITMRKLVALKCCTLVNYVKASNQA